MLGLSLRSAFLWYTAWYKYVFTQKYEGEKMAVIGDFEEGNIFKVIEDIKVYHRGNPRVLTAGAILQQVSATYGSKSPKALFEVHSGSFVMGKKFPSALDTQVVLSLDHETLQGLQKIHGSYTAE